MNEEEKKEFKRIKKQSQEAWLDDDDIKFLVDSIDKLQKENEELKNDIANMYIENNNFEEIDKDRAIELIKNGNRHLVYNQSYFDLQKENEELKNLMAHKNDYTKKLEEDLFENCSNYVIPVQKVKDKIEKEKLPLVIIGGRKNKKTLEYGIKLGRRQALRELIEEREDK